MSGIYINPPGDAHWVYDDPSGVSETRCASLPAGRPLTLRDRLLARAGRVVHTAPPAAAGARS